MLVLSTTFNRIFCPQEKSSRRHVWLAIMDEESRCDFFCRPGDHIITEWAYQIPKLCSNALFLEFILEGGYSPKGGVTPLSWTQETGVQTVYYTEQWNARRLIKASWSGRNSIPIEKSAVWRAEYLPPNATKLFVMFGACCGVLWCLWCFVVFVVFCGVCGDSGYVGALLFFFTYV